MVSIKFKLIALVFLLFASCNSLKREEGYKFEYESYPIFIYYDNIQREIIPELFVSIYYSELNDKIIKNKYKEYDSINKRHNVYIFTKGAKNGYLSINKNITKQIQNSDVNIENLTIVYILDNEVISIKEQFDRLRGLNEKDISKLDISLDTHTHLLTVNIFTK